MKYVSLVPHILAATALVSCVGANGNKSKTGDRPNVLVIQTDEQSFRTMSCYRELMCSEYANIWGSEAKVETPHLDRLAREGAIYTNYYATSPVSTPSRASIQTGLYPIAAKAPINDMPMDTNIETFADVLRDEGYQTTFVGKWHLGGTPAIGSLYLQPGHNAGWSDREYMFETEHNKWYVENEFPLRLKAVNKAPKENQESMYSTDYLTNRCIEKLERDSKGGKPFCMFLSIPDPHSPDIAREPYKSMYSEMKVEMPVTMSEEMTAKRPKWAVGGKNESQAFNANSVREYFGMVKCIDDNVGRILDYLDENNLAENTIVVFTTDHGEMMFEHHKKDKGVPYESAARIPYLIRYPAKIKAGKVINKTQTNADFAPTILALTGSRQINGLQHGIDDSKILLSDEMEVNSDRIIYITDSPFNVWTAATDGDYKLVLSCRDTPWLFDLEKNPQETINYYSDPAYKEIAEKLQKELLSQMELYKDPSIGLGLKYLLSEDDKVEYVSPYEGKTLKEINQLESQVLGKAILDIHKKCFN